MSKPKKPCIVINRLRNVGSEVTTFRSYTERATKTVHTAFGCRELVPVHTPAPDVIEVDGTVHFGSRDEVMKISLKIT